MNKKKFFLILIIFLIFLAGGEFAKRNIFPYGSGLRAVLPDFLMINTVPVTPPLTPCIKEYKVNKIFEFFSNQKINNIFIGDSVVLEANSTRLFNLNYEIVAVSGATIGCLPTMLKYIKKIEPKNLILYLGGNDADGISNYNSNKASEIYSKFVNDLKKINSISHIYLVGVNIGLPSRRNTSYVLNLNKNIKSLQDNKKIFYIKSFEELNFKDNELSQLSYDGEHLNYLGYKKWFAYLNKQIPNFIYK